MAVDFTRPVTSDLRAAVLQEIRESIIGLSRMLDGETLIGTPTGAIRYNAGAVRFERWSGSAWTELPLGFLPLSGGTLTGAVTGPSGSFTALTVAGNAVWHAGNFAPASYLGVNATARRASALTTIDPGLGAGDAWVGAAGLLFRDSSASVHTVYHSANFNPATKQDTSSAWNTGNFNPATKQDTSSAWNTGNFNPAAYAPLAGAGFTGNVSSTTNVAAPSITANGNAAALITRDRNDANRWFHLYVTSGVFRIWDSYSSDRLTLDSAGNLTAVGNITAFSDRRLKELLSPLDMALGDIASLQSYEFRRTDTGSWEVGVMAQDVRAILPLAVMQDERGMLSLDYARLAVVAVTSLAREVKRIKQQLDGTR